LLPLFLLRRPPPIRFSQAPLLIRLNIHPLNHQIAVLLSSSISSISLAISICLAKLTDSINSLFNLTQ
jgi:hypothetical protein